ncbi:50S ribosomal protein L4 [Galdieria sulphuraria]|nr:50S ribosomal protein L4 [Galdieria sulphuraria]
MPKKVFFGLVGLLTILVVWNFLTLCKIQNKNSKSQCITGYQTLQGLNRTKKFEYLIELYLKPWKVNEAFGFNVKIYEEAFDFLEPLLRMGGFRVRLHRRRVFYRATGHWYQTYRNQRMEWLLKFLTSLLNPNSEMPMSRAQRTLLKYDKPIEFFVNVGDGPRITIDSSSGSLAGFPIFSFRTSSLHIDIPIPDPVEYGSNGNYVWDEFEGNSVNGHQAFGNSNTSHVNSELAWEIKESRAVFRGSSSCFQLHKSNWYLCPRIPLAKLSILKPDLLDAGITSWIKLSPNLTNEEIESSLELGLRQTKTHREEARYKYILDVDGGLGSSRKRGILGSGSVLLAQDSPWKQWYEPLLIPFHHYVPVARNLEDLLDKIMWSKENDAAMKNMAKEAKSFVSENISLDAIHEYWSLLLLHYAELLHGIPVLDTPVRYTPCLSNKSLVRNGPLGCVRLWLEFKQNDTTVPFGCRFHSRSSNHFCWRQIPGYAKETKYGVETPYNLQ